MLPFNQVLVNVILLQIVSKLIPQIHVLLTYLQSPLQRKKLFDNQTQQKEIFHIPSLTKLKFSEDEF